MAGIVDQNYLRNNQYKSPDNLRAGLIYIIIMAQTKHPGIIKFIIK